MTINDIYKKGNLSVRSYRICMNYKFKTIFDLKEYHKKNQDFTKLKNCGRRSSEELTELCNGHYLKNIYSINNQTCALITKNPLKKIVAELTRIQRELFHFLVV